MRIIVGLGNPGREYEMTRHNMGFIILDEIAHEMQVSFSHKKFDGSYAEGFYEGEKVILLKPLRYMNLSGEVVKPFLDYFKIKIEDMLIISDDLDMEFGRIRLKKQGSSGGHNGLKNIEHHLGSSCYARLKIGISNQKNIDTKDYVLGRFSKEELLVLEKVKETVVDLFRDSFHMTYENLMNRYNINNNN